MGVSGMSGPANPYAGFGGAVTSADFIGRGNYIRAIRDRMFASFDAGCVSIVGPPRIGKSSLAQHVLDSFATGTNVRGLTFLPVWIEVSAGETEQTLFRELAYATYDWLADREEGSAPVPDRLKLSYAALGEAVAWDDMRMRLKTYLRQLRRAGYQVVAVLDEFDAARDVFTRSAPFEFLRTIGYQQESMVSLITTSRRSLSEIAVPSSAALSDFPGIFGAPVRLGGFDDAELTALIARSPYPDPALRKSLLAWLTRQTGGQPFLSAALLSALHDRWKDGGPPANPRSARRHLIDTLSACGPVIADYHDRVTEVLREDGRLASLLEVAFGTRETVHVRDLERMSREGLLRKAGAGWAAYSPSFHEYLRALDNAHKSDDWKLWERTETGVRVALSGALRSAYGDEWVTRLEESHQRIVVACRRRRKHPESRASASDNILDYSLSDDLPKIMSVYWDQVEPFFGHGKDDWLERLAFVGEVRVKLAHHRHADLSGQDLERFRFTCREILKWLADRPT